MGRIRIGRSDIDLDTQSEESRVVYVDRPVEVLVEKLVEVEVEKIVHDTVYTHSVIEQAPEIQVVEVVKVEYVQDPELLKKLEEAEYTLIQKELDYKRSSDLIVDEINSSNTALLKSRSQHMTLRKQRSLLVDRLRKEKQKRVSQMKLAMGVGGILSLVILALLIK